MMSKIACYHQKARPHAEGKDVSFDAKIIQKIIGAVSFNLAFWKHIIDNIRQCDDVANFNNCLQSYRNISHLFGQLQCVGLNLWPSAARSTIYLQLIIKPPRSTPIA